MEKSMKRYMPILYFLTFFAFILGFIIPFILGVGLSFCKFTTEIDAKFIGFSNYVEALKGHCIQTFVLVYDAVCCLHH